MKFSKLSRIVGRSLMILVLMLLTSTTALAQEPAGLLPVQGQLLDADGTPVDGAVSIVFTLYQDIEGQMTSLWTSTRQVPVEQGYFSTYLGRDTELDLSLFRDHPRVMLGIAVDGDSEMPLIDIGSTGYAGYAEYANQANQAVRAQEADTLGGKTPDELDPTSGLTCTMGQVLSYDGSAWGCGDVRQRTDGDIAAAMDSEGFVRSAGLSGVASSGRFEDLENIPSGLADGDDDSFAALQCPPGLILKSAGTFFACQADETGPTYSASGPVRIVNDNISLATGSISGTYIQPGAVSDVHVAGTANIAPSKISGTAATLTGSQSFDGGTLGVDALANRVGVGTASPQAKLDVRGDVRITGDLDFVTPKTGTFDIPAATYNTSSPTEDDPATKSTSGYMYISGGTPSYSSTEIAPVRLPDGVTITRFSCYYYDGTTTGDMGGTAYLRRRPRLSTSGTSLASVSLSTSNFNSTVVQEGVDTTILNPVVDNAENSYFSYVFFSPSTNSIFLRFYGCKVEYEATTFSP